MPRQYQPVEYNSFIGGLVTEASPLTFPQNASLDEENFVLNKDGSRSRRLGINYEDGYQIISSNQDIVDGVLTVSAFKWDNAGGLSTNTVLAIQIGASIDFFRGNALTISPTKISTYDFSELSKINKFSYASVDGKLVVTVGSKDIYIFTYDTSTNKINVETKRLLVRDLFGLDAIDNDGKDLREGGNISLRPSTSSVSGAHVYNLRNQGWAIPHTHWVDNDIGTHDTITQFTNEDGQHRWPSNADNIAPYIYANTKDSGGTSGLFATVDRFDVANIVNNPPTNTYSPIGYFIIDALDRGASRRSALADMQSKYPQNDANLYSTANSAIETDSTPYGPTCVCQYAGRVFYGGFSGEVVNGDSHSPKLSSYLLYSQLVSDSSNINLCYQAADPTNPKSSDLVDTDGGFVRIEGAYGIIGMAVLQSTLFIFANNGVWTVSGGNGGFTATSYQTSKLTDSGCISQGSIVAMQDSIFYWGLDGIYSINRNEYGDFRSSNITNKTIKRFYMSISDESIRNAEGIYDSYNNAVKWVYNNYIGASDDTIELNLDTVTGAYYKHRIKPISVNPAGFPLVVKGVQTDPFRVVYSDNDIVVGSDQVVVTNGSLVITSAPSKVSGIKEIVYLTLIGDLPPS